MKIDLYYAPDSSPCRAVLLTAKALGLELNLIHVDLDKEEHLKPEFLKMNPQHVIPTLVDNGFVLWESRAIIMYLVNQYGKDDSLYPKDPKKRALVDLRLNFDLGTLYASYATYYYPVFFFGGVKFDSSKIKPMNDAMDFLNTFLKDQDYVAGDSLTIADFSIIATVSTFEVTGFDISIYPNIMRWYAKVKAIAPGYEEANGKTVLQYKKLIEDIMKNKPPTEG